MTLQHIAVTPLGATGQTPAHKAQTRKEPSRFAVEGNSVSLTIVAHNPRDLLADLFMQKLREGDRDAGQGLRTADHG